ncbi:hypothetical protein B0T18DRAFT_410630, partial [Schizothecium vesticola]
MRLLNPDHTTWATTFAHVARRYHHLRRARPRLVEKLPTAGPDDGLSFRGAAPWNRFLRLGDKTSNFHNPDPVWSYSQHDALLVYPRPSPSCSSPGHLYHIYDPSTAHHTPVPFGVRGKHIRRVRLAHGVLIFEWTEAHRYREFARRHFVTAFRVSPTPTVGVTFLSEWKLHCLGLPLTRYDGFLSTHSRSHYAAYLGQPNRSIYVDHPIEQLAVWDLSSPSPAPSPIPFPAAAVSVGLWTAPYHPPQPPQPNEPTAPTTAPTTEQGVGGPPVIHRLSWRDLTFYCLRRRTTPQLRELRLDEQNLYLVEEGHPLTNGQHSSLMPPAGGGHVVKCTGIPVVPFSSSSGLSRRGSSRDGDGDGGGAGAVYGPAWVH